MIADYFLGDEIFGMKFHIQLYTQPGGAVINNPISCGARGTVLVYWTLRIDFRALH